MAEIRFPKPLVAIIGDSGTGKSTSLRNMPWAATLLIDTEMKGLPFSQNGIVHYKAAKSTGDVFSTIIATRANKAVKYGVIDSWTKFCEYALAESKALYKGYDIYKNYGELVGRLLSSLRSEEQIWIITGIPEHLKLTGDTGSETTKRRLFVHGKEWEGKVEKEFLVVLYTTARRDATTGKMTYSFMTNTDGMSSAKSPMGMFTEELIPNDLGAVLAKIDPTK